MMIKEGLEKKYKDWRAKNTDPYSACAVRYLERWAEMMEKGILTSECSVSEFIEKNASRLSYDADTEGITGFMYRCSVGVLSCYWKYGDVLREWHNNNMVIGVSDRLFLNEGR